MIVEIRDMKKILLTLSLLIFSCTQTINFNENEESEGKVIAVKAIFTDLNIPKHTKDMMKAYYTKAMRHLDAIDSENKAPLITFSEKLMDRIS